MDALQVLLTWDWQGVRGLAFFVYCIISTKCSLAWVFTGDCYTLQVQKCSHMWQVPKFCQHWTIQNFPLYSISKQWEMILDFNAELDGVHEPEVRIDEPLGQGYWVRSKPSHYEGNSGWKRHWSMQTCRLSYIYTIENQFCWLHQKGCSFCCVTCCTYQKCSVHSPLLCVMYMNTWSKWYSSAM